MGCGGSKEDTAMVEAIGERPVQPIASGDGIRDALASKKYQVELRSYNKRLAQYQAEVAERKAAGLPPKAQSQAQAEPVVEVDEAAEAAKKAAAAKEAEEAAERRRRHEEEKRKNDPFLKKMAEEREARAEAKRKQEAEQEAKAAAKAAKMEEERMLKEMEDAEAAKAAAAAKALEEAAAKKAAEASAKVAKEQETALDRAMARMFSRDDPEPEPPKSGFIEATGRWDDGATCFDQPGGLTLQCSRCGNRPRPGHDFRCRLHNDALSNGDDRPVYPTNVDDKMAMRRYLKDLDDWSPSWLEPDEEEVAAPEDDKAYPLHCPRCEGKTEQCGAAGVGFSTNLVKIMLATDWLPSSYEGAVNAPTPTPDRRFETSKGLWGHCNKCKLLVSIHPE